jgi:hypothetical protein
VEGSVSLQHLRYVGGRMREAGREEREGERARIYQ